MSIAVSAVIRPSRLLRSMTLAMSVMSTLVGIAMLSGWPDNFTGMTRGLAAIACIAGGIIAGAGGMRKNPHVLIDISGIGQIRIGETARQHTAAHPEGTDFDVSQRVMRLLPNSTLWSRLMILRLQAEQGSIHTIVILPDTTPPTSFRALSVACHWIAAHNNRAESEKT